MGSPPWHAHNSDERCYNLPLPLATLPPAPCNSITATLSNLHRKKLNTPAPYLRTSSEIPTLPLLRAWCQNLTTLRSNLCNEEDTILPYHGIPSLRCNPTALIDQGPLLIRTHHPVDNIHHLATSCVTTLNLREQLGQHFETIMVELGLHTREWCKVCEEIKTSLTLASDPPAQWQLQAKTIIQWRQYAMPHCAAFAIKTQEALQQ